MAIVNGYCTLADFKAEYDIGDTGDDTIIEGDIEDVSRLIDQEVDRRFYTTNVDEERVFDAKAADHLLPHDDILSITSLATDPDGSRSYSDVWAATDYDLAPYNAALDKEPYTEIAVTPNGNYSFPVGVAKGVKLAGKFGYCTLANVPRVVRRACLTQTKLIYDARHSNSGIDSGASNPAARVSLHPFVVKMLDPVRRTSVG